MKIYRNRVCSRSEVLPLVLEFDPRRVLHELASFLGVQSPGYERSKFNLNVAQNVVSGIYALGEDPLELPSEGAVNLCLFFVTGVNYDRRILEAWYTNCVRVKSQKHAAE